MTDKNASKGIPEEAHKLIATFMSASAPIEAYLQQGKPLTNQQLELISLTVFGLQNFLNAWKRRQVPKH
jgi:hypothetical protein